MFQSERFLQPGQDADLVLLDDDLKVKATFCEGTLVHRM